MAIAFDANSGLNTNASFSFTVGSGSNLFLFLVAVVTPGGSVSGATYNSVALTQAGSTMSDDAGRVFSMWYLIAPATGSNTLTVSYGSGSVYANFATSFTGVDQTSPIDATGSGTSLSNSPRSISLTSSVDGDWAVAGIRDVDGTPTDASLHIRVNNSLTCGDSNGSLGAAGTYAVSFTPNGADPDYLIAALIKPSVAAGATSPVSTLPFMGAG